MKHENKDVPKTKSKGTKAVQEDLPSSKQKPMGSKSDIAKNDKRIAEEADGDDIDTNSVGILKNKGK